MRVLNVVGARPNFMKVAPIHRLMLERSGFEPHLVHTGQHYDEKMSKVFFEDLQMPEPDSHLGVGSGSHAEQTARVMVEFEKVCLTQKPDLVLVVGDVNSTLACSIVASKLSVKVAHVEAGLRSWDRQMPEEINRVLTDQISDFLFTHSPEAEANLLSEGISRERIHFVGNTMIDSLVRHLDKAEAVYEAAFSACFRHKEYGLITLHRPSNVDRDRELAALMKMLEKLSQEIPLLFPVHPRTLAKLESVNYENETLKLENKEFSPEVGLVKTTFSDAPEGLVFCPPLSYLQFLGLMKHARLVITDSGGVQEETSYLGVPCITARSNTERPITLERGTNILAGEDPSIVYDFGLQQLKAPKQGKEMPLWDGNAATRILSVLTEVAC